MTNSPDLRVKIADLELKNPVLVASGTFGFGFEYSKFYDPSVLGGIMTKGTTLEPRPGNKGTRLCETPAGLLNSIGLENPGVDKFISEYLPEIREKFKTAIIVNIAGNTVEDYAKVAAKLDNKKGVDALEVNISCPNVKEGGMAFGATSRMAATVVRAIRNETGLPLIVKLSPNVTDIVEIAEATVAEGADALSLINTLLGMAIDVKTEKAVLGNIFGGLSGPAIKPVALRAVWQVSQKVDVPIIGMGGIMNATDALEFILAGANAVSIGTANFVNPLAPVEILEGIRKHLLKKGYASINDIVGKAWKGEKR